MVLEARWTRAALCGDLAGCAPPAPCLLLHGAGMESSRNAQCVPPWMLTPPAPSGWAHEAHGPVSYVPTHTHSHIYAAFSVEESDPRLELQVGEGSPRQVSQFGGFSPFFFSALPGSPYSPALPACALVHPRPF